MYDVTNATVRDCVIDCTSDLALWINEFFEDTTDVKVFNNSITGSYTEYGILLHSDSQVYNNTIMSCDEGIEVRGDRNIIRNNIISNNNLGIDCLSLSSDNEIYYNRFLDNLQNADDDGTNNIWDDGTSEGNFWSDYDGVGEYEISGVAGSVDRYPIGPTTTTTDTTTTPTTETSSTTTSSSQTSPTTSPYSEGVSPMIIASLGFGVAVIVIIVLLFMKKR